MFDERLAERVRAVLAVHDGISERRMFGGIAFLLDGKMCVGVMQNELVVRVGAERYGNALKQRHVRPMDFTRRPMRGMVYVAPAGLARGPAIKRWVDAGMAAAREAPSRRAPASKGHTRKGGPAR